MPKIPTKNAPYHPLNDVLENPRPTGRIAKWHMILFEFGSILTTQKAIKGLVIADHLADNPRKDDYQSLHAYFSDEEVMFIGTAEDMNEKCSEWRLFFDGTSIPSEPVLEMF